MPCFKHACAFCPRPQWALQTHRPSRRAHPAQQQHHHHRLTTSRLRSSAWMGRYTPGSSCCTTTCGSPRYTRGRFTTTSTIRSLPATHASHLARPSSKKTVLQQFLYSSCCSSLTACTSSCNVNTHHPQTRYLPLRRCQRLRPPTPPAALPRDDAQPAQLPRSR